MMASQRYVSTSFWDDSWVQSLDPSEKFLYLYLLTNPLTNIAGVYEITMRRICFDTGYNEETVSKIMARFSRDKKAYLLDGYAILANAPKHQKWQTSDDTRKGIDRIIAALPDSIRFSLYDFGYAYPGLPPRPPIGPHMEPIGPHEAPKNLPEGARPTLPNSTLPNSTLRGEGDAGAERGRPNPVPPGVLSGKDAAAAILATLGAKA